MQNIIVGRYSNPDNVGDWEGWIEPEDKSWIVFHSPTQSKYYGKRDPVTGAVIEE